MIKTEFDIHSNDNSLFVTARCNNRCLMCSQPPLRRDDIEELFERNLSLIDAAPADLPELGITGGEPTLLGDKLFVLLDYIKGKLPKCRIHILSNGRAFKDKSYTRKLGGYADTTFLIGIPFHSDYSHDHNRIAQAANAWNETLKGLYYLAEYNIRIELRIVINRINYKRLPQIARYIYRNLPFVKYVSFMGLEDTGYAIKNREQIWITPQEYSSYLEECVLDLATWGMNVSIFNLPHCVLPASLYEFAMKSISDWKVKYEDVCEGCVIKDDCCGLFATSKKAYEVVAFKYILKKDFED